MTEIASVEAKSHFSDLLKRVMRQGEKFVVTVRGKPVATLGPVEGAKLSSEGIATLADDLRAFRAKVNLRGPVLKPGESWNDFAREGLD